MIISNAMSVRIDIFIVCLLSLSALVAGQTDDAPPSTPTGRNADSTERQVSQSLFMIRTARDAQSARSAYEQGLRVSADDARLHAEYLRTMVDLGLERQVEQHAEYLVERGVDDGLAYAVHALALARRGRTLDALIMISIAARHEPQHLLVQRLAGELLAWYDFYTSRIVLPERRRADLVNTRTRLERYWGFQQSYWSAYVAIEARELPMYARRPAWGQEARRRVRWRSPPIVQRYYGWPWGYNYYEYAYDPYDRMMPPWPGRTILGPDAPEDRLQWEGRTPFERAPVPPGARRPVTVN